MSCQAQTQSLSPTEKDTGTPQALRLRLAHFESRTR